MLHPGFESDRAAEGTDGSAERHGGDAVVYARRYEPWGGKKKLIKKEHNEHM